MPPRAEPPPQSNTHRHWAETAASNYLTARGYQPLAANYRTRGGELDLVMRDGATVVVIEVRQRKHTTYGHPTETITPQKLHRIRRTTEHYLQFELREPNAHVRLDALAVLGTEQRHTITHLKGIA